MDTADTVKLYAEITVKFYAEITLHPDTVTAVKAVLADVFGDSDATASLATCVSLPVCVPCVVVRVHRQSPDGTRDDRVMVLARPAPEFLRTNIAEVVRSLSIALRGNKTTFETKITI